MKQRAFKRPEVLYEMLLLRLQGWPLDDLAFRYQCDKTSVRKACIRHGLPNEVRLLPRPIILFKAIRIDWNGERINRGKTYAELLEEQKKRQLQRKTIGVRINVC